jgi:putative flippase GtrA
MLALLQNENFIQFFKYALAGGLATLTHIIIFHLVALKKFPALQKNDHLVRMLDIKIPELDNNVRARNSMICNFLAFMIANLVAYITNILWVFEAGRYNIVIEILLFYAVSGLSMIIGSSLMGILIKRFGLLTTYAFITNIITAVMMNYILRKYVIFLS